MERAQSATPETLPPVQKVLKRGERPSLSTNATPQRRRGQHDKVRGRSAVCGRVRTSTVRRLSGKTSSMSRVLTQCAHLVPSAACAGQRVQSSHARPHALGFSRQPPRRARRCMRASGKSHRQVTVRPLLRPALLLLLSPGTPPARLRAELRRDLRTGRAALRPPAAQPVNTRGEERCGVACFAPPGS